MSHRKLEVKTLKWYPTASRQKVSEGKQGTCEQYKREFERSLKHSCLQRSQRDIAQRQFGQPLSGTLLRDPFSFVLIFFIPFLFALSGISLKA